MPRSKRKKEEDEGTEEEAAAKKAKETTTPEGEQQGEEPQQGETEAAAAAAAAAAAGGGDDPFGLTAAAAASEETKEEDAAKKAPAAAGKGKKKKAATASTPKVTYNAETMVQNFDHYLFQLLSLKAEHGNYHVAKDEHPELHAWMQFLKKEYKNYAQSDGKSSLLSAEQVKVLEFLHVPVTARGEEHWNRFYDLLVEYNVRHGHVLVPRLCEIPGLGDWVTDQRRQYKAFKQGQATQLTKDRRDKLEALDFAWTVRNRPEWDHRFEQLMAYKAKNNDCKVPQHYKENKALGKWVAKQREQYKLLKKGQHSFLTPYRLEKLNQAGFVWQVRTALDDEVDGDEGGVKAEGADTPAKEGAGQKKDSKEEAKGEDKATADEAAAAGAKKDESADSPKKDKPSESVSV